MLLEPSARERTVCILYLPLFIKLDVPKGNFFKELDVVVNARQSSHIPNPESHSVVKLGDDAKAQS